MQRNWMAKGVRDSIKKSKDGDKHVKNHHRATVGEAGRPRRSRPTAGSSGWRWSRSRARSGSCAWRSPPRPAPAPSSPRSAARSCAAAGSRSARSTCRSTGATGVAITGANGSGKSTLLAALLGRVPLDEGTASLGPVGRGSARSTRRGRCSSGRAAARRLRRRGARLADGRGAHPAGQVRADRRPRPASRRDALTRRAHPGGAGAAAGARHQRARARRADQPPRPARHRAARGGAGRLHRHAAAGHPRPPDARVGAHHPPARGRATGRSPSAELVRDADGVHAGPGVAHVVGQHHQVAQLARCGRGCGRSAAPRR